MNNSPNNTIQLPNEVFLEEVRRQLKAGHTTTFRVRGWSMRPFLEHGRDKVLLLSPQRVAPTVGCVALVLTDDRRYVLHRVVEVSPEGRCTLWGDGNICGRETCSLDNVIGVAGGFYVGRKERFFDVNGRAWRWYSWWWMHTSRLRRWQLLFFRLLFKVGLMPK